MEIKDKNGVKKDIKVYELGYLLVPSIPPEDVSVNYGNIKELVLSSGGEIISDEMPKSIVLAYAMTKVISNIRSKFNTAYFGWTKFTIEPEKVLEIKKKLDLDQTIVRFLMLKTVKENTIAAKRFMRGDMEYHRPAIRKSAKETAVPMNKEAVDKEIDALVAM